VPTYAWMLPSKYVVSTTMLTLNQRHYCNNTASFDSIVTINTYRIIFTKFEIFDFTVVLIPYHRVKFIDA
jgi:hypothetical protein